MHESLIRVTVGGSTWEDRQLLKKKKKRREKFTTLCIIQVFFNQLFALKLGHLRHGLDMNCSECCSFISDINLKKKINHYCLFSPFFNTTYKFCVISSYLDQDVLAETREGIFEAVKADVVALS